MSRLGSVVTLEACGKWLLHTVKTGASEAEERIPCAHDQLAALRSQRAHFLGYATTRRRLPNL
jgi:hypothetical protein